MAVPVSEQAGWRTPLDRPFFVAFVSLVIGCVVLAVGLIRVDLDASRLVHAAPPFTDAANAPSSLTVEPTEEGFDGQFYFRLALDPLSTRERVDGIALDVPPLRAQRIVYPLVAGSLAGRDAGALVWTLIGLNLVALVALGWAAAQLARASGRVAAWGLVLVGWPGFVFSFTFDLSEIVLAALLATGLLAVRKDRVVAAVLLLSVAVLTRESAAVVPVAMVVTAIAGLVRPGAGIDAAARASARRMATMGGAPLIVWGAWQLVLWRRWGELPILASSDKNARAPFVGFAHAIDAFLPPTSAAALFRIVSLGLLVAMAVIAMISLRATTAPLHERVGALIAVVAVTLLSEFVWLGAASFMRATTEVWILCTLVVFGSTVPLVRRLTPALAGFQGVVWMATLVKPP